MFIGKIAFSVYLFAMSAMALIIGLALLTYQGQELYFTRWGAVLPTGLATAWQVTMGAAMIGAVLCLWFRAVTHFLNKRR